MFSQSERIWNSRYFDRMSLSVFLYLSHLSLPFFLLLITPNIEAKREKTHIRTSVSAKTYWSNDKNLVYWNSNEHIDSIRPCNYLPLYVSTHLISSMHILTSRRLRTQSEHKRSKNTVVSLKYLDFIAQEFIYFDKRLVLKSTSYAKSWEFPNFLNRWGNPKLLGNKLWMIIFSAYSWPHTSIKISALNLRILQLKSDEHFELSKITE